MKAPLYYLLFCCLVSLTKWVFVPHLWIYTCQWLYLCGVFYAKRHQFSEIWRVKKNSDLISHTHTKTHSTHRGQWTDINPYKYILTPPAMCWQQLSVLQSSTMSLLFENFYLVEVIYLVIRFNKTKFLPWNANNTKRYSAHKQNTYHHSLRER